MITEEWRPIPGYEGRYEASNLGRIRSLPKKTIKGTRILKHHVNRRNGYCYVCLVKDGEAKQRRVHILVMEAFTDFRSDGTFNPDKTIDHLDFDKTNNSLSNLEVCSQRENDRRAKEKRIQKFVGVEVIDLDTGVVFESYTDASRSVNGRKGAMVARVCDGKRSHYRGHRFARLADYKNGSIPQYSGKVKRKTSEMLWR